MDYHLQRQQEWQRQIFEERLHRQREQAENERHNKTMEQLSSTERNYTVKIEAVEEEMGNMAKNILDLLKNKEKMKGIILIYEKKFEVIEQELMKFNAFMEEKSGTEASKALENENLQLKTQLTEMQQQMNRMEIEINKRNENWKSNLEWVKLHQNVLEFIKAIKEKEGKLPVLGQNNSEDFEMQKFVNFVLHSAEKLELATCQDIVEQTGCEPGTSTSSNEDEGTIINEK